MLQAWITLEQVIHLIGSHPPPPNNLLHFSSQLLSKHSAFLSSLEPLRQRGAPGVSVLPSLVLSPSQQSRNGGGGQLQTYSTVINLSVPSPVALVRLICLLFPFSFAASVLLLVLLLLQFCTIKLPETSVYLLGASRLYVVELGYALPALRRAV